MSRSDDEYEPAETVAEFVSNKGAVSLIVTVGNSGATFTDLIEKVDVSRNTLSKRLRDAENLNLINPYSAGVGMGGKRKPYDLTLAGTQLLEQIEEVSYTETFYNIVRLREELKEKQESIEKWAEENGDDLGTEWVTGSLTPSSPIDNDQPTPEPASSTQEINPKEGESEQENIEDTTDCSETANTPDNDAGPDEESDSSRADNP